MLQRLHLLLQQSLLELAECGWFILVVGVIDYLFWWVYLFYEAVFTYEYAFPSFGARGPLVLTGRG